MHECVICGDNHEEELHGDAISIGDWSLRDESSMVNFALGEADYLISLDNNDLRLKLDALSEEWGSSDLDVDPGNGWFTPRQELAGEFLNDIESILGEAGYYAGSDGYSGTWWIHNPVPESF